MSSWVQQQKNSILQAFNHPPSEKVGELQIWETQILNCGP